MTYLVNKLALDSVAPHAPGAIAAFKLGVCNLGAVDIAAVTRVTVIDARIWGQVGGGQVGWGRKMNCVC